MRKSNRAKSASYFSKFIMAVGLLTLLAFVAITSSGVMAQVDNVTSEEEVASSIPAADTTANVFGVSETGLYIVRFNEPALASYTGGIANLAATSPETTDNKKLDVNSAASQAYLNYLQAQHDQFAVDMAETLGRNVNIQANYLAALNGMAVEVSHAEATKLAELPGVAAVYGDTLREITTDVGPGLIQAPAIWDGDTGSGVATRGEGIVIGVIDSGINSQHPSFAATDGDGYTHTNPYGAGVYTGWCATNPGFCNEKLIGAYTFHPNGGSPEDTDGHGSHTAGTAGGNAHIATFNVGNEIYNLPIQGVAPRANIVAYKVCDPTCPSTASVQAVNSAILNDEVDVLNYSISGGDFPWNDAVDLAFLDASNAGIYVSASAGNSGPGPSTVAKTGPWNASTAASTHNRAIGQTLDVTSQGEPAELQDLFVVPGEGTVITTTITSGILYDATNNLGCDPFAPGTFDGNLALIQRGSCSFAQKATNAQNAGATGVVLFQSVGGPPITAGGNPAPPLVMMDLASGIALRDHVLANPTDTTVRINAATSLVYVDEWEDIVAGFSSRGPSQYEILKPDYIAPGVNILAAVSVSGGDPVQYGFLQGTSMSSPHSAGAAALMMALHPTWSPAEVRSAMATTAVNGLFKEDGMTPADPFDVGSGRLDLSLASTVGLVFNETGANYAAADPSIGGDPKTLNQPSLVNYNCLGTCTFTRTVTSVLPITATYTVLGDGPVGMSFSFSPATFDIPAGGTQEIVITVDVSGLTVGDDAFGSISLQTNATHGTQPGDITATGSISYTGDTTGAATWQRPFTVGSGSSGDCSLSGSGSNVPYLVQALSVDTTGAYDLVSDQDYDGYLLLYADSFNPADQCLNLIALNDDGGPGSQILGFNLTAGTTYYLVTSGFSNTDVGNFTNTITGSGEITLIDIIPGTGLDVAGNNLPVVIIPGLPEPIITVDPSDMTATQVPDTQTSQTLTIGNDGGVDLDWEFGNAVITTTVTVWDQPQNGSGGIVSDFFIGSNAGAYSASDFALSEMTDIAYIFAAGFDNSNTLNAQPSINWAIYADDGGVPAGHPEDGTGMVSALWFYTSTVAGPGVDITDNNIALDLMAAGEALSLDAGTYWLTVYPSYNVTGAGGARWNWYQAATVGAETHLVSPGIFSVPNWTSLTTLGVTFADTAFRIEAPTVITCEHPDDVSWLMAAPTLGTVTPAGTTDVTVTFDSTGLMPGEYTALLCVTSNDAMNSLVQLPVTLEVLSLPTAEVDIDQIDATQESGTQTTHTMVISNTGESNLDWYFEEAEGMLAGPVPAVMSGLTVGSDRSVSSPTNGALVNGLTAVDANATSILPTSSNVINSSWSEGFDDITLLPGMGWAIVNNSDPVGTATWFQGNPVTFPAHSGDTNSYIGVNFESVAGANTISNWLLTPEFMFNNGDSFSFWTRTPAGSSWPDRLEVRWSGNGGSVDVGSTATSVGDFDTLLLSVNPDLTVGGYPEAWTQYTVDISGLSGPTSGRLAFRYFVTNGGPSGSNSNYIGIDTFEYIAAPPTVLYDNGPFVTSVGDGPGGADVSLLQNVSLGMTTLGGGVQFVSPGPYNRIADEFEVTTPGGWTIDNVVFYGYQTGSTTDSSFTGVNYRIWDGPPNDPNSTVIFGDTTTNQFASTDWTGAYRYSESAIGTTRPVMHVVAAAGLHLDPGTYWLDWQLAGSLASGPWQPPITILGETVTGNAIQMVSTGWQSLLDTGASTPQGAPFQLWGGTVCSNPSDVSWITVDPDSGMTAPSDASEIEVTLDSTGVPAGDYTAYLCLNTNDPSNELIVLPVNMTVTQDSYLRVAHLAPFDMDPGTAVTVTLNGAPVLTDFNFGESTQYLTVPSGDHDLAIYVGSSMTPALTATVNLVGDEYYSAIAVGGAHGWPVELQLHMDDNTAPAAGEAHVRFGHLAPFTSVMTDTLADIRLADGTVVVDDVPYDTLAGYLPLPAGEYDLMITSADGSVVYMDLLPVSLGDGDILYAVAVGDGTNQDLGVFAWATDAVGMMLPMKAYGVEFMAETDALTGMVGTTVTYTVHVTNTGNFTDTFDMSADGNAWTTMYPMSVTLGAGEMAMAYVTVDIPADAADGESDMVTITATSQADASVMADVILTTTASEVPMAMLRVAHLAPFAATGTEVTVRLNGTAVLTDFAYLDSTNYLTVPAGTHLVQVEAGATTVISAEVTLMADGEYTVVATGGANGFDVAPVVLMDDNTAPDAGKAHVRIGHLAPFADSLAGTAADVRLANGTVILPGVQFGDVMTGYLSLDAGDYDLQIVAAGTDNVLIDLETVTLAEGDILYVFATGDGTNQPVGAFAYPTGAEGFPLPLKSGPVTYTSYLPIVVRP